ncbi:hypothetical protein HGRIS_003266 [Hohenbuehelia grisea]|uniref:Uncharacterized protein n=1 Tax=Hohenbuehelia grisea TaxID=104357 RepID=A0ABR3JNI6_9AGAR
MFAFPGLAEFVHHMMQLQGHSQEGSTSNGLRRTNDNSPPAHDTSSTRNPRHLDDELTELQKRLAEHERREHEIIKRERQLQLRERELAKQAHHNEATACRERVEVLRKPKGEAGDSKRGFQLQDAMGLGDSEDGDMRYNEFLHTNRQNAHKAGIDLNLIYRQQDPAALAKLFKLNRMAIPYLTRERFPNDWPQVKALKQYIRNARRGIARKQRGRTENRKKRNADDTEGRMTSMKPQLAATPPNADVTLTRWMRMEPAHLAFAPLKMTMMMMSKMAEMAKRTRL